jgi:hypothetical protein
VCASTHFIVKYLPYVLRYILFLSRFDFGIVFYLTRYNILYYLIYVNHAYNSTHFTHHTLTLTTYPGSPLKQNSIVYRIANFGSLLSQIIIEWYTLSFHMIAKIFSCIIRHSLNHKIITNVW